MLHKNLAQHVQNSKEKGYEYQLTFGVSDIIQLWCISNVDDVIDESRNIVQRQLVETRNGEIIYFSSLYGVVSLAGCFTLLNVLHKNFDIFLSNMEYIVCPLPFQYRKAT